MPRGIKSSGASAVSQLNTPEARAKVLERIRATAALKRPQKLIAKLAGQDVGPIDEQIAALEAQVAQLRAGRQIILALRGGPAPPPAETRTRPLADQMYTFLHGLAEPLRPLAIATALHAAPSEVNAILRSDDRFADAGLKGWTIND